MYGKTIPVFCAARSPRPSPGFRPPAKRRVKQVSMPRFRKEKEPVQLTEAVRRILMRASTNSKPFGVFIVDGRLLMSNTETGRYAALERRWSDSLVGAYDRSVDVVGLIDDLKEHFRLAEAMLGN